jgi:hypothetical protein
MGSTEKEERSQKEGCLLHKGQGEKKMLDAQRGVVSFIVLKKAEY